MLRTLGKRLIVLAVVALLALPGTALAVEVAATTTEVTFHISHPGKEYDAHLLPGGATIIGSFDPNDLGKTGFDVTIRVAKFNSDNTRRDSHMMEVLEGLIFPTITWKVARLEGASGPIKPGDFTAYASGPLSVHGITKPLDVPVAVNIASDGTVTVTTSFSVSLESYEIERPELLFIPIEDEVPIKVKVVFPGGGSIFPAAAEPPAAEPAPATAPPTE